MLYRSNIAREWWLFFFSLCRERRRSGRDICRSYAITFCYHSFAQGTPPMIYAVDYTGNFKHVSLCGCPQRLGKQTRTPVCISIVLASIARTMEIIEHAHYEQWICRFDHHLNRDESVRTNTLFFPCKISSLQTLACAFLPSLRIKQL